MTSNPDRWAKSLCATVENLKENEPCGVRLTGIGLIAYELGMQTKWSVRDTVPHISRIRDVLFGAKEALEKSAFGVSLHFLECVGSSDIHVAEDFCSVVLGFQYIHEITHGYVFEAEIPFQRRLEGYLCTSANKLSEYDIPPGVPPSHKWWWHSLAE